MAETQTTFAAPTTDHLAEVRAIVRPFAKANGIKISVRKGRGCSFSRTAAAEVQGDERTPITPAHRIALCEALAAAGFEKIAVQLSPDHSLAGEIKLAQDWGHDRINVAVAKLTR